MKLKILYEVLFLLVFLIVGYFISFFFSYSCDVKDGILGAIIGFILYIPARLIFRSFEKQKEHDKKEEEYAKGRHNDPHLTILTIQLRQRSQRLNKAAQFTLVTSYNYRTAFRRHYNFYYKDKGSSLLLTQLR